MPNRKTKRIFSIGLITAVCLLLGSQLSFSNPTIPGRYSKIQLTTSDSTSLAGKRLIKSLDSFYRLEKVRGFNGSVLIGYKGDVLYERYFGYADISKKTKLTPRTMSQLASTSKPFLGTAILWLHENKYLDIDQPVKKYLTDFPYADITVKMLLNHRSGLPEYFNFATRYWPSSAFKSNEDLLQLFNKVKPRLTFKPGTRFRYCNTNYALLARVLEEVTERTFPRFMKEFIFDPLGMDNTFVYDPLENDYSQKNIAVSYKRNWVIYPEMYADGIYGDKNIFSTVRDMYKWDQSFYNNVLISKETEQYAYTGCSNEMPGEKNYGLGWRMMDFPDSYKIIFHNGWWHGNNTVFYRFVQDNFTIIVLGNRLNHKLYDQAKAVYDITQQVADWDNNREIQ